MAVPLTVSAPKLEKDANALVMAVEKLRNTIQEQLNDTNALLTDIRNAIQEMVKPSVVGIEVEPGTPTDRPPT